MASRVNQTPEERLSFHVLNRDIVDKGLCALCYGCVSFCTAHELNALGLKGEKPAYLDESKCLKCGICHLICPRTKELDAVLKEKLNFREPVGSYETVKCLRTTDEKIREVCCDGGVVTSVLKYLLDTRKIDGAVLSQRVGLWDSRPLVATSFKDLLECAGSRLAQTPNLVNMGRLTTYAPIFGVLKQSRLLDLTRLAVVGSPCQIETIQKMRLLRIFPSNLVIFTIGLFCFESFLLQEAERRYLEEKIGATLEEVERINLKDGLIVNLRDGKTAKIALEELNPIVRPACLACTDFANFSADISVGGLGSPEGYTTTIVRNQFAITIIEDVLKRGYLTEIPRRGIIKKVVDVARKKEERGERVLAEKAREI